MKFAIAPINPYGVDMKQYLSLKHRLQFLQYDVRDAT